MHAFKPSTHKLNLKAAYNRCLKAFMWTQKGTIFISAECQAAWSRKLANSFKTHAYPDLRWCKTILSHVGLYSYSFPWIVCALIGFLVAGFVVTVHDAVLQLVSLSTRKKKEKISSFGQPTSLIALVFPARDPRSLVRATTPSLW